MHKYVKSLNANFHSDGVLDPDVREVSSFQKTTKACAKEFVFTQQK